MAKPFDAHLFICTNSRPPGPDGAPRASCGAHQAEELRKRVKELASKAFKNKAFRVNSSGCLGACEKGIAAVCYSDQSDSQWCLELRNDAESEKALIRALEKALP
jgi:predicted metal-binding protein